MSENDLDILLNKLFESNTLKFNNSNSSNNIQEKISKLLYEQFEYSTSYLNSKYGNEVLEIFHIPSDLLAIIFNIDNGGIGFVMLFNKSKVVLVLCEKENYVAFIGKKINNSNNSKSIKLLRLSYENEGNEINFRDSTGLKINTNDIIAQIIKWGLN
ncbi:MAG: hypothetical protein GTO02_09480 [Candidatus Dadabacteria bacterium]|nr:hypothetical protein [Candidatus Dadabacteria bacterium]NIQ14612.1 hypothetical protein [Candidatus Dadabacteria bacterium]